MQLSFDSAEIREALQQALKEFAAPSLQSAQVAIAFDQLKDEVRKMTAPWLSLRGAAEYCGCSLSKIQKLVQAGKLHRYWLDGAPRIKRADLDKLIETSKAPAVRRGKPTFGMKPEQRKAS